MDWLLTFYCNGKVNTNDWQLGKESLILRGEVEDILFPRDYDVSSTDVQLFDRTMPAATAILSLKHLTKCMDMQLKILNRHEKYNHTFNSTTEDTTDFYYIRRIICEFVLYVRIYVNSIRGNLDSLRVVNEDIEEDFHLLLVTIKRFLDRLRNIPDSTFHYAPSNLGNKCKQPVYHMYHMHIELRWLFITLVYTRSIYMHYSLDTQLDYFENTLDMVINDLIYISLKTFEMTPLITLKQKSPYNCTCIRELWLMLQLFLDSLSERKTSKPFWDYVNVCITGLLNRKALNSNQESSCTSLTVCKNPELFCLWLIHHLTLLYGYNADGFYLGPISSRIKSNYEQVEKILKTYVSKGGKEGERDEIDEELRTMIPMLNVLMTNWWQPRVSFISLLWDCFHKRLEEPFLLQSTGPWSLSVEKKSVADILKQVRDRIENSDCVKESSYGMFLRLLGSFLRKNYNSNDTRYWNQIKGRVYSKFSKSKVQEFSVTGLYNFISLFFTLAVTTDTANVCTVMLDLLPSSKEYNVETSKKCNIIWKGKLAILLLYYELRINFSSIATTFVDTVNMISCRKDDTSRSMMISFVDVFSIILPHSKKMDLGEYLLISGWIDRYLLECPNRMVGALIKVLNNIIDNCVWSPKTESVGKMLDALWCHVACRVRQLVFNPVLTSDYYREVSKLAVAFTLEALREPVTAKKHKHSATSLFQHFASSIIVKDIRIIRHYLALILENEDAMQNLKREIKNFDTIVVQAWIKCSIIGYDTNGDEIKILQNYILQLNDIQSIFSTSKEIQEFQESSESVLIFMMCSMKRRNTFRTEQERVQFDVKWKSYFNHIEKWIFSSITEETKETEHALWIYRCIGTLILCNSPTLYTKNQPNNMFRILLNKTVLSTEHPCAKSLGKKIFSMIVLGMESLNVRSDISLQSLIRDLFDQYMPLLITIISNTNHFKVSDGLLKCFRDANADLLRLIFEMLMSNFLSISSDNVMHKHSYLVMILLQNLLKGERQYAHHTTEFIIVICTPHIIGCYIKVHEHHPHKQHTIDFVKSVVTNPYYKEDASLRDKFNNAISGIVERSLATNQQGTFEFMRSVAIVNIDIIHFLSPHIERTLINLERYRRPNAASLRFSWEQFQRFIQNSGMIMQSV